MVLVPALVLMLLVLMLLSMMLLSLMLLVLLLVDWAETPRARMLAAMIVEKRMLSICSITYCVLERLFYK